jgi:hypothetical protein
MIFECSAAQPLRLQYAQLFAASTTTVLAFVWQSVHIARFVVQVLAISVLDA